MRRLFLLYAILIFAKKAPDMIKKLLNMKDDSMGLKGLNIKNKMGDAALIGKHVKKGMMRAEGGLKRGLGAGKRLAGNAIKASGKIVGKGIKDGTTTGFFNGMFTSEGGISLKGGLKGAIKGGFNGAKGSIDKLDANGNQVGLKSVWNKDNLKGDGKKVLGNIIQGGFDYKNKDNTKGAVAEGARSADVSYKTIGQRLAGADDSFTRKATRALGIDDSKEAANRYDRNILGMPDNNLKIKIDSKDFFDKFRQYGFVTDNGNGNYGIDYDRLDAFTKSDEYKSWSREKQLTFDKYTGKQKVSDIQEIQSGFDAQAQLTSAIASGRAQGMDTSGLEDQLRKINNRMVELVDNTNIKVNGQPITPMNVAVALSKAQEDASKNSSELSELKASQKPKSSDDKK